MVLSDEQIKHVTAIAALWIQELNRLHDDVLGHLPSGWTNGRTPRQNIKLNEVQEIAEKNNSFP